MEEFKNVLKRNGVAHLFDTLKQHGVYNLELFVKLSKRDVESLNIDEYIDKLRLNKILDEIQKEENILTNDSDNLSNRKIIVVVRKRPPLHKEDDSIEINHSEVIVNEHKLKLDLEPYTESHSFNFDIAYDKHHNNQMVYTRGVREIVSHVIKGGSGSVIAYGQTGSGKTYTMTEEKNGMVELALKDLMKVKKEGQIVFCEIYLGQVYDLLNNRSKIILREVSGVVHLTNIKSIKFDNLDDVCRIIKGGLSLRRTGVTGANLTSSRSHAVIIINFSCKQIDTFGESDSIVFVDLAGSERGTDRQGFHNDIKNEGAEINKSLLALKECIRGIEKEQKHLPFRQSKLTQILKNSFIGTSKTCIIATVSPSYDNVEHTLNTLRYASRIKEIQKGDSNLKTKSKLLNTTQSPVNLNTFKKSSPFNSSHSYADKFTEQSSFYNENYEEDCFKTLKSIGEEIQNLTEEDKKLVYEKLCDVLSFIRYDL